MARETRARDILEGMLLDANAKPTDLPLSLLESITNDFSDDKKIGSGGYASVYKGKLLNGTVAVKRLDPAVDMDEKSFDQEVMSMIRLKHNNIVRFLGYCGDTQLKVGNYEGKAVRAENRQRLLCFEFMPNGGLDKYVKDASRRPDWRTCYQIIKGICRGLQYLHQHKIVHLDLKPANILLDHHMVPKIADFGLAKCFDDTQTRAMTLNRAGSVGYMPPEFIDDGEITLKSDIFSLGVIIKEILTGKKHGLKIEKVLENWRSRFKTSKESTWLEHVKLCAEISIECTDEEPVKRPSARRIMDMLDEIDYRYGFIETVICTSATNENVDALIECVGKNLGYHAGKPVAAFTIYKCLLHWESFEAKKTSVFDRLIQLIGCATENEDDNDNLAYWLSNTSCLLFLLQRTFKVAGAPGSISRKKRPTTTLFGRMALLGLHRSPMYVGDFLAEATGVIQQVEAKYPALLFRQQATAFLEKIYANVRDNIKKELSSLLFLCIQAPRTMKASMLLRVSGWLSGDSQSQSNLSQSQSNHWMKIIENLDDLLKILQDNYVPPVLSQKIFQQIFSFVNVQLFNSLLLHRECCSFSNGEYVRTGLAELELWCEIKATTEYAASSWDELKHIRQAVGFLVMQQKFRISYAEITNDLCPILTVQQLYKICTQYWDEKYNTGSVSSDVLSGMRMLLTQASDTAENSSFMLDDDSSIPFSVDDITYSIQKDFLDVKPAEELLENPAFQFLQD